jgi:hypothetical protein
MYKHTQGPWKVFETPNDPDFTHEIAGIASVYAASGKSEGNARLISAAPELLSELQRYLPVIEYLESKPELWGEVAYPLGIATANGYRHAIAKATGEEK